MARRRNETLRDFETWLADQGLQDNSARVHAVNVRALLKAVPELTEAGLTTYVYALPSCTKRASLKSAWRHYRRFCEAQGIVQPDIGMMTRGVQRQLAADVVLPAWLQNLLVAYMPRFQAAPSMLAAAKWGDVTLISHQGLPYGFLRVHAHQVTGLLLPMDTLRGLLEWAAPETRKPARTQPLVPTEAGGTTPTPSVVLRDLLIRANAKPVEVPLTPSVTDATVFDLEVEETRLTVEGPLKDVAVPAPTLTSSAPAPTPAPQEPKKPWAISSDEDRPLSTAEIEAMLRQ